MCQQSAAFQRELSALRLKPEPHQHGAKSELDDNEMKIEAMQSGATERMIGTREWRRRRISQGSVENCVVRNCVCLSFLFIDNSIHIHCSSSSRPRYRSSWFQQNQKAVNWTNRSPLERAQYRQGSMGSTSYQCSTRGDCSTN